MPVIWVGHDNEDEGSSTDLNGTQGTKSTKWVPIAGS